MLGGLWPLSTPKVKSWGVTFPRTYKLTTQPIPQLMRDNPNNLLLTHRALGQSSDNLFLLQIVGPETRLDNFWHDPRTWDEHDMEKSSLGLAFSRFG